MKSAVFAQVLMGLVALVSGAAYCPPRPATTSEQLAILDEFIQKFYVHHNVSGAFNDHADVNWIEHDPNGLSGRQNAIDGLSGFIPMTNQTIMHRGVSDNIGYIHFREDMPGSPTTVDMDIIRFNGTCMMEHWDVSQAKSPNATNPLAYW
jgi:predicted SnoaL-like aldol condensation-catalyzing enzyme